MKVFPRLCALVLGATVGSAAETIWNFSNAGDRLAAASGTGTLGYYDPGGDGWGTLQTAFGKASSFGLPAMTGGDPDVMLFPTCTAQQGYVLTHGASQNGPYGETDSLISNYTVIMDVLYPTANDGVWRALWQTDPANAQDAEFYVRDQASGGIGISGNYLGRVTPNVWHRIAIVVRAAPGEGYFQRFIDGQFVGGYGTSGSAVDIRWAAGTDMLFFTDDGGETAGGYLSSLRFVDRALTVEQVQGLGGPHASGAAVAGPPAPPYGYQMPRLAKAIGHRGGALCCAPDNTLASVQAAITFGLPVIEIDTRLSADGVCILMHDDTVERTTNGAGEAAGMTVAQLKTLDAGSWFDPSFAGEKVPTLAEVMTLAKGKLILYFDLKVTGQISAIQSAAAATGFPIDDCWFWVDDDEAEAAAIRGAVPNAKIIWGDPPAGWANDAGYFDLRRSQGVYGFDLGTFFGVADAAFTLAAKKSGFIVSCYTVLDPLSMVANAAAGVDYIETDYGQIVNSLRPPQQAKASLPFPANGATDAPTSLTCTWVTGAGATSHRVFFGTTAPGTLVGEQSYDLFSRDGLAPGTTYYWRVDEVTPGGTVTGDVWHFATPAPTGLADAREWTFDTPDLSAALGSGIMTYAAATTAGLTSFGTTDGVNVPHIGGQPARYLSVPAFTDRSDGYLIEFPDLGPNGGGAKINQYTFLADVFIPDPLNWLPFFQTAPANAVNNDADFYLAPDGSVGIGDLGYSPVGLVQAGQWHRIGFAADLGAGVVDMFLDGVLVRHRAGGSLRDGRFSLNSNANPGADLLLFNENYGDGTNYTHDLFVSSLAFVGHTMTNTEITTLGGPKAAGIFVNGSSLPALSAAHAPPTIVLTWSAQAGVRLQRSDTLGVGSWSDIPATLGAGTWSEALIPGGKRYFRLAR